MKNIIDFSKFALQASAHAAMVIKFEGELKSSAAAGTYIQIHDSASAPANGDVPKKSWLAGAGAQFYKEFKNGQLTLAFGCYVAVSTTEATLTLGAGNNSFDVVSVELYNPDTFSSVTQVADSSVQTTQVWAQAANPKQLTYLLVTNDDLDDAYVQIHATDVPATASIVKSFLVPSGTTKKFYFGNGGFSPTATIAGVIRNGCTLAMSTTRNTYVAPGSSDFNFIAEYFPTTV